MLKNIFIKYTKQSLSFYFRQHQIVLYCSHYNSYNVGRSSFNCRDKTKYFGRNSSRMVNLDQ